MSDFEKPWEIVPGTICANCNKREATQNFAENHSAMDFVHGFYGSPWCSFCIKTRQLEYAREHTADIPKIEKELAELGSIPTPREET